MEEELSRQFGQLATDDRLSHLEIPQDDGNGNDYHDSGSESCNLIVNYLPHDIDDSALRELFAQYGEIIMTKVVRDKNTKKSLGYGFVKFVKEEDALFAIDKMNGYSIAHKSLKVSVARPPSLEIRNCKLYVTNLPKDYTEREVVNLFKDFGDIIECRVLKDKNARANKGVAFVQFNLKSQANNALSLNGCQLDGSSRGLVVKYAEDQHKKKELSRLQTLTAVNNAMNGMGGNGMMGNGNNNSNNNHYNRGPMMMGGAMNQMGMPPQQQHPSHHSPHNSGDMSNAGMMAMGGGSGGMMLGGVGGLGNPKGLRIDPSKSEMPPPPPPQQQQQQQQAYYYQQQQGIPTMYGGLGSPMMSPLNSPQLSIYMPAPGPNGGALAGLDYSPSPRRPMKGRKGFIYDSDQQAQSQQVQQQQAQQNQSSWYNAMPPHMSYMQSPGLSLPAHSPVSLSSLQSQQIQQNAAMSMAMLGSPINTLHRRPDNSPPNQQQQPQQSSPTYSGSVTLNISNLPAHADVALLHDLFSPYGRILSAQIDVDQSSQSRLGSPVSRVTVCSGRGRVQMAGLPQAEFAAHALSGAIVCEGGLPIQVQLSFR